MALRAREQSSTYWWCKKKKPVRLKPRPRRSECVASFLLWWRKHVYYPFLVLMFWVVIFWCSLFCQRFFLLGCMLLAVWLVPCALIVSKVWFFCAWTWFGFLPFQRFFVCWSLPRFLASVVIVCLAFWCMIVDACCLYLAFLACVCVFALLVCWFCTLPFQCNCM